MRTYRVLIWFEVDALDKGDAEIKAKKVLRKKAFKGLKTTIYSIEEG